MSIAEFMQRQLTVAMMSVASNPSTVSAQSRNGTGYGDDRAAINDVIAKMPNPKAVPGKRDGAARHNISNIVIQVNGHKAKSISYWFHYSNEGRDEWAYKGGKNPAW